MPGHGRPILQTFDDWVVRVNRRLSSLERRQARLSAVTGQVALWATAGVPDGWVALDGASYHPDQYPLLAALLGVTGGQVTVPDVQAPDGLIYIMKT